MRHANASHALEPRGAHCRPPSAHASITTTRGGDATNPSRCGRQRTLELGNRQIVYGEPAVLIVLDSSFLIGFYNFSRVPKASAIARQRTVRPNSDWDAGSSPGSSPPALH